MAVIEKVLLCCSQKRNHGERRKHGPAPGFQGPQHAPEAAHARPGGAGGEVRQRPGEQMNQFRLFSSLFVSACSPHTGLWALGPWTAVCVCVDRLEPLFDQLSALLPFCCGEIKGVCMCCSALPLLGLCFGKVVVLLLFCLSQYLLLPKEVSHQSNLIGMMFSKLAPSCFICQSECVKHRIFFWVVVTPNYKMLNGFSRLPRHAQPLCFCKLPSAVA